MSEIRKANTDHSYFLTCTVVGWINIFTRNRYSDLLIDSFKFCMDKKGLQIFAYVIMPNHIHFIARQENNKLADVLRDFKSFTAKQILQSVENEVGESSREWLLHMFSYFARHNKQNSHQMFWQKTNHPVELTTPQIFDQKMAYIHNNPVRSGLVTNAESWYYSSSNPLSTKGL
ncbi:MAG: REP-associated tyrosine transposase [Bacteroidia bacterium]